MLFKDINCRCGIVPDADIYMSGMGEILEMLGKNNISACAVSSNNAIRDDIRSGNTKLLADCSAYDSVIPAITLLPPVFRDEMYTEEALLGMLDQKKRIFFRMYPESHRYHFTDWQLSWLADVLEETRIPVLINIREADMDELAVYKKAHPGTRIVLTNATQWMNRMYVQLCRTFENIMVETSNIIDYMGLEVLCREIGSEKILFGTNTPCKEPYDSIFMLMYAGISNEEKEIIAYGNYDILASG